MNSFDIYLFYDFKVGVSDLKAVSTCDLPIVFYDTSVVSIKILRNKSSMQHQKIMSIFFVKTSPLII